MRLRSHPRFGLRLFDRPGLLLPNGLLQGRKRSLRVKINLQHHLPRPTNLPSNRRRMHLRFDQQFGLQSHQHPRLLLPNGLLHGRRRQLRSKNRVHRHAMSFTPKFPIPRREMHLRFRPRVGLHYFHGTGLLLPNRILQGPQRRLRGQIHLQRSLPRNPNLPIGRRRMHLRPIQQLAM